jgi:trans-aconitate methyltransferase
MKETGAEEISRLEVAADNYRVRFSPDEAAVQLDSWWIERYVKGPTILELGCADGVVTEMLLKRAASLDIVDGSSTYCAMVEDRIRDSRMSITNCLYEEFEPSRRYDDLVIARSLEMVADPVATLTRIRGWLKAGARLHVVVQNAESLHRRIGCALGMLPRIDAISAANALAGNRRIYTKEMLIEHVQSADLKVKFLKGYFLKPFDYATMSHARVDLTNELIPALYEVGKSVPDELCLLFYALCVSTK